MQQRTSYPCIKRRSVLINTQIDLLAILHTVLKEANIITVSCPCCMEQRFSFSRNVLNFDGGKGAIQFSSVGYGNIVKICYTGLKRKS